MTVSQILASKGDEVITANCDQTLLEIASLLGDKKIGALIVMDNEGAVCGIASERDIIRKLGEGGSGALNHPITSCMTEKIISCTRADTVDQVMGMMTKGRFRHLPVMEKGALLGIISIGDVVKRKIENIERDAEEMKRYIAT